MGTSVRMANRERKRREARQLREQGCSLRRIANDVGASLSSVSVWVRDISPTVRTGPVSVPAAVEATTGHRTLATRRCGRCCQDLPLSDFNRHPKGHQWWCRGCYRTHFRTRGQLHRDQTHEARHRRRDAARAFIHDYLTTHPCCDCGASDPLVLEFDHVGDKRAHIAVLTGDGASLSRVREEIDNCEVVCVNCHRIRTALRGGSWRLDHLRLNRHPDLTPGERRNMEYVRDVLLRSHCADCREGRLIVLEFDHVGAKTGNVLDLARRGCALDRLRAEIAQCEVRCANCHRRRTLRRIDPENEQRRRAKTECPRQDSNLQPSP
jgi:hypothetical protein